MHVPVYHQHALEAIQVHRSPGCHRYVVVQAEPHGGVRLRVVAGRAHEGDTAARTAAHHRLRHHQRDTARQLGGGEGGAVGVRVRAKVEVAVMCRHHLRQRLQLVHVRRVVHAHQLVAVAGADGQAGTAVKQAARY